MNSSSSRRDFLQKVAGLFVVAPVALAAANAEPRSNRSAVALTVYKDPECGCCKEWVKHMQKAGFTVTATDTRDMNAIKVKYGVPSALASCHTALVGGYIVEGHAPADVVQKMLAEKPSARGIAVPGMPMGSPGMEGPTKDKYNVMLFDRLGKATVYASR